MTNKYQEAYDALTGLFGKTFDCAEHADQVWLGTFMNNAVTIREALQAGAEGRILPVYPYARRIAIDILDDEVICTIYTNGSIYQDSAKTPAEAMQNAIDKIGGEE